ncbi:signal peptidase II [Bradyrhizobium manausense]|uniref:signal peptidase II n=1 Tax=Bradyrhizobium manausense TaxID=989370 RepID=UPI001BA555E3|nr:signal peptidase II [Bradyrhizobium manausense]MBR0835754.1 signal peptidase II [Bradyrhizobium manausense]
MPRTPSHRRIWLIVAVALLDQSTKQFVVGWLEPDRPVFVLSSTAPPSIDFLLSYNKGVSFSFLRFAGDAQRWPLVGLSLLGCGLLGWWLRRVPPRQPILATGLALIIGGALGNMLDRARIGSVIDFVHLSYQAWSFAIFNVADTAITLGAIVTVVSLCFEAT